MAAPVLNGGMECGGGVEEGDEWEGGGPNEWELIEADHGCVADAHEEPGGEAEDCGDGLSAEKCGDGDDIGDGESGECSC